MREASVVRRGTLVAALAAGLVVATLVDGTLGSGPRRSAWRPAAIARRPTVEVTAPGTLSAAWYCAEGTSDPGGRADETVVIANAGERPLRATVSVLRGQKRPVRKEVRVAPRSRAEVRIADLVETSEPAVVVEVFGGDAAVEHVLAGNGDLAVTPCVRRPAARWLFAGGSTSRSVSDVIAVLNPFDEDATVEMTFYTADGVVTPQALSAVAVPARSRVSVPVHEHVLRQRVVGAEVVSRFGRVVAERSTSWSTGDVRGLAVSPGVTEPAARWAFPEGIVQGGIAERLWILNPGPRATEVQVSARLGEGGPVEPAVVEVPARGVADVVMRKVVGRDAGSHGVIVEAVGQEDVVVQQVLTSPAGEARVGVNVMPGIREPATRWLFPAGSADERFDEWIVLSNPGAERAAFRIAVLAGGLLLVPEGLGDLRLAPGGRASYRLGDALKRTDLPVVVESDQPIEAARGLFQENALTLSAGIPFPG
jgi:hypothetical protein